MWFRRRSREAKNPPTGEASIAPSPVTKSAQISTDFVEGLRRLVAQAGTKSLLAGNVTLIGTDQLNARFGEDWPRMAARVHKIVCNVIERHLTPGDIYTDWQDAGYVIVFASLSAHSAGVKCRLIAAEIARTILGEEGAEELSVKAAVSTIDGDLVLSTIPSVSEMLSRSAASGGRSTDSELDLIEEDERNEVRLAAQLHVAQQALKPSFVYRPMWDTSCRALSAYLCAPLLAGADGTDKDMYSLVEQDLDVLYRLEGLVQARALSDLASLLKRRQKLLLILPVHFESLAAARSRRSFVENLVHLVSPEGRALLLVEIVGVPDGVPHSRLESLVVPLRQKCRAIIARVPLNATDLRSFKLAGIHAVGSEICSSPRPSETVIIHQMNRFKRLAERAEVTTFIRGLDTTSLTAAAVGAGFRYIDGDAVATAQQSPNSISKFNVLDLYRPLISRLNDGNPPPE